MLRLLACAVLCLAGCGSTVEVGLRQEALAVRESNLSVKAMHEGDIAEGIRRLDRALALDPRNPVTCANASDYFVLHRFKLAEYYYADASTLNVRKILYGAYGFADTARKEKPGDWRYERHFAQTAVYVYMLLKEIGDTNLHILDAAATSWLAIYRADPSPYSLRYIKYCHDELALLLE